MCGTCGCGQEDQVKILKPGEGLRVQLNPVHQDHSHDHGHDHHHHHSHDHSHDHHHHGRQVIDVEQDILRKNDIAAARNRGYFEARNIVAVNIVSSPGSGKTSLLERTLKDLKDQHGFYVIEGDQQTMNDANRIDALNIPVVQVNTGKGCHLESDMVYEAIKKLNPSEGSFMMIENVGNLVCPSMFDLGESVRVVVMSVTEGDDKPIKYPDMFHSADLCVINKVDLLPYLESDIEKIKENALKVNHHLEFVEVSATKGDGMDGWYNWLTSKRS